MTTGAVEACRNVIRVRSLVVSAVVSFSLIPCVGATASREPPWVSSGVAFARDYFRGSPEPRSVTWGIVADGRWVQVIFETRQICARCTPPRGFVVTGQTIKITWYSRGSRRTSIRIPDAREAKT